MRTLLAGMKVSVILIFMTQRYKPQQDLNDTWTVIDARTARAAEMGSRTIIGMNRRDAEELAELLNRLEAQKPVTQRDQGSGCD